MGTFHFFCFFVFLLRVFLVETGGAVEIFCFVLVIQYVAKILLAC